MNNATQQALDITRKIKSDLRRQVAPPDEGFRSAGEPVLPRSVARGTRGYIEQIVNQINGCYENGWFDACAVMIRRLLETLIIEAFEKHGIDSNIKNRSGDFLYLSDLISKALAETSWNLSRNTKQALPRLKDVGDKSAHSRRFNAHRADIEKLVADIRIVTQEMISIAGLK